VSAWQRKAETIGNLNYPIFLKNNENKVKLTLSVTIAKNGSLLDYVLINSSGNNTLDDAAIKIVKLTFPFKSFPKEMESFSEITIIRDWQFGDQEI
jgi:protein TonB